jgi:hypothetical protein
VFGQKTLTKTLLQRKQPRIKQGLHTRNKILITAIIISALLFSPIAGTQLVDSGRANPLVSNQLVSPPYDAKPPEISIHPSKNNTVYASNNVSLNLNVSIPESKYAITIFEIYYVRDWVENTVYVYRRPTMATDLWKTEFSIKLNFTEIPDGNHNITFTADATGGYANPIGCYPFIVTSISMINFTVDTTPPSISVLSMAFKTYETPDAPLNFAVNEPFSQLKYSLDGQANVTIAGNTTLLNLPNGEHNLTVYATDTAGNTGTSETINFTVAEETESEPFPATIVIASIITVAIVCLGLLVYFKKRKH